MAYLPPSPDQTNAANSTTAILTANSVFTGTSVDLSAAPVSKITIMVFSDQASAAGGLAVQYSEDNANWDRVITTTVTAGVSSDVIVGVLGRYMRIVYTNGTVNQATFRLQTLLSQFPATPVTRDLDTAVQSTDNASVTRAVLTGLTPTTNVYTNVATDVLGNLAITAGGSGSDAFGRMRVSEPTTLFNVSFVYDMQPLLMQNLLTGTGSGAKTANVSSVTLATGGTLSGASSIFQSHGYYRYEPGKSQFIIMTGVIGAAKANVRSQIGYFDINDGVFFDQSNGIKVTQRSSTSGSPVDTSVAQASWNVDKCDGTGPSGFNADFTKTQIFFIDFQWLGTGRVRFGFFNKGVPVICHQIFNDNTITVPYMNRSSLPICWQIANTGVAASTTSMTAMCGSILSEAGQEFPASLDFTANNGNTPITVSASVATPLLSIQPKTTFNSITNRSKIVVQDVAFAITGTNNIFWQLIYNGTLTGASFSSVNANSGVNRDVSATVLSGGTVVDSGYVATSGSASGKGGLYHSVSSKLAFTLDIAGTTADIYTLVATGIGGTVPTVAEISWTEER